MPELILMTQDEMPKKDLNLLKIQNLQLELEKNPRSMQFIQLADLYLEENMIEEAQALLERGLQFHPQSVSAHLVLAKTLKSQNQFTPAEQVLSKVIRMAPQNWQAYLLRADTFVRLQQHKKALEDFRKVLVFNPQHPIARKAIPKLEMLAVDEPEDSHYSIQSLQSIPEKNPQTSTETKSNTPLDATLGPIEPLEETPAKLERILSLVDAFQSRQEYDKALKLLHECRAEFGRHSEIDTRLLQLSPYENAEKIRPKSDEKSSLAKQALILEKKQKALELLLRRISDFRNTPLVHS